MKTYYVKVRGNIYNGKITNNYCHWENYTIWKVKIRYNKSKSNLVLTVVHDTNIEENQIPEFVNGVKVMSNYELDEAIHDEDRLKY
jgi:TusA-related sulfurtransferase